MSKFQRIKGKVKEPYLMLVYGVPGVGKSSFAADAPGVVFIDVENGTGRLNVDRMPQPKTYTEFLEQLKELCEDKSVKTIAIDTVDHLEHLITQHVLTEKKAEAISDIGYGKGFELVEQEWVKLFKIFDLNKKNKNIILLGHAEIKQFSDPNQTQAYDRYQLKLGKKPLAIVKDKVDALLFCNYKTLAATDQKTKKVKGLGGAERAMYTEYRASHDGKNRFGLPYELDLPVSGSWAAFEAAVESSNPESQDVIESTITGLLTKLSDEQVRTKANEQFAAAKISKDIKKLVAIKNRLLQVAQE